MKKLFTVILALLAMNCYAQEMIINKTDGSVIDRLPLMELYQTTHSTDAEGASSVKVELLNGASYTCSTGDIENAKVIKKDDMLKEGKYASMKLVKTFDSVQDLQEGDLIGIVDEEDYDFDDFVSHAYYALSDTCTEHMVQDFDTTTRAAILAVLKLAFQNHINQTALQNLILTSGIRYHITDIVYAGKDIDGTLVPLSARLIYPYYSLNPSSLELTKIYVDQHTTLTADRYAPTRMFFPFHCAGVVFNGYMVVQPDLLGFGVSNMRSQMFVNWDINGAETADCMIAAMQYVDLAKDGTDYKTVNLSDDVSIISSGSSQGASTAMGFTYYMENKLSSEDAAKLPKVSESHLCAGAYNPLKSIEDFIQCDSVEGLLLPLITNTVAVARPDYMKYSNGTAIHTYDLLASELKDMTWDDMEDDGVPAHKTIWQILNDKQTNFDDIGKMFTRSFPYDANPEFSSFRKLIADGILTDDGQGNYSLNYEDERVIALKKYLDDNDLTNTSLWVPKSDIIMLHSSKDNDVPYVNSQTFYDNMNERMTANGNTLTFNTCEYTDHTTICVAWMMAEITDLSVDTILSLMSSN